MAFPSFLQAEVTSKIIASWDVEKPGDVSKTDYLNSFGLLTDHIDVTANPNFVLALVTDYATPLIMLILKQHT